MTSMLTAPTEISSPPIGLYLRYQPSADGTGLATLSVNLQKTPVLMVDIRAHSFPEFLLRPEENCFHGFEEPDELR